MPVTLYTETEVEVYTRLLAKAYESIRDEAAKPEEVIGILMEIERTLGWKGPPPAKARPPDIKRKPGGIEWTT